MIDPALLYNISVWISVWGIPLVLAITLHEAAHGYIALRYGDPTAYVLGRVTLNPLKHIDIFGTILLPLFLAWIGSPFLIGWAKPVPVDHRYFKKPRQHMAIVAIAGPLTNVVLALGAGLILKFLSIFSVSGGDFLLWIVLNLKNAIFINVILAVFNMLPILPLDGGRVLNGILPSSLSSRFEKLEPFGMAIVLALLFIVPWIGRAIGIDLEIVMHYLRFFSGLLLKFVSFVTGV